MAEALKESIYEAFENADSMYQDKFGDLAK